MKKADTKPERFRSISELHHALGFPKPTHPLVSLVDYADIRTPAEELPRSLLLGFYKISYKKHLTGKVKYGQNHYDFDEGGLSFFSPHQVISGSEDEKDYSGYTLLIHPDLLRNYPLASKIRTYGFFSYAANEALHLSEKEKQTISGVFEGIREELGHSIDQFSQDLLVSQVEVLLNYSNRFYSRQFITRRTVSQDTLVRMEGLLSNYFDSLETLKSGLPTVGYLAGELSVSPRYLSDMLRSLTGQNAQQHIHEKLIEKAKEYLTATNLSVSEIAYQLGFEHPQSFNKVFKKKTKATPIEFKQSFN